MKLLTREQILSADDLPFQDIDVPEWGGTVRVRSLRGLDRSKLMEMSKDNDRTDDWIEKMIIACTCDESSEPIFKTSDIAELKKKNAKILQRLFLAADDLNMLSAKKVEDLKGESEPIPK